MKKQLSIFFLVLFLFNIIGYKAVFYFLEQRANQAIEQELDLMKLDGRETVTVKIPINLPYQTNWKDFERVDGEMTYKGKNYKYFKRKIYNDSLILVCVNFNEKTAISKKNDDYFKKTNDLAGNASKNRLNKQHKNDESFPLQLAISEALAIEIGNLKAIDKISPCPPGYPDKDDLPPRYLVNLV